jgi:hypothetical protein
MRSESGFSAAIAGGWLAGTVGRRDGNVFSLLSAIRKGCRGWATFLLFIY